ncbi:MAG: isoaspartyl peptidase/L-asparaginase [Pseudomonadaceae bacterium]|nr:isoaspartyl peptidase/L-asparaginase [Pseudomonadaceae bacterium]
MTSSITSCFALQRVTRQIARAVPLFALVLLSASAFATQQAAPVAIAIHGGAGTLKAADLTDDLKAAYLSKMTDALRTGHDILRSGGASVDAVVATVEVLEQSPLFNAGIGAVMTFEGKHELDASLMSGADLQAGAVSGVTTVGSPIRLAHTVMLQSPHVMLAGPGAEGFARSIGMPAVDNTSFTTPRRAEQLQRVKERINARISARTDLEQRVPPHKWGTVGAVALDRDGNLAAATSTGGMTAKRWGRVGDSPIIGAGTFADNRSCAVSATGHGEYFIRFNVAADICARVRYRQATIGEAAQQVLFDELLPVGGTGGVIVINPRGDIVMPFNTPGMYRGAIDTDGNLQLGIFKQSEEQ